MTSRKKRQAPPNQEILALNSALEMAKSCICFNLRKATRRVTSFYDKALKPSGLKVTQVTLLTAIRVSEPVTIKRLAKAMVMDRTTLGRKASLLNKNGLIDIKPGDDLRTRKLSLTEKGHASLAATLSFGQKAQAEIIRRLGEDRWTNLVKGISGPAELT